MRFVAHIFYQIRQQKSMPNQNIRSKNNAKSKQKAAILGIEPERQRVRNLSNAYRNFNYNNAHRSFIVACIQTEYSAFAGLRYRFISTFPFKMVQNGFGLIFPYCCHFEDFSYYY